MGRRWAPEEDALLRELYPTTPNSELGKVMGRSHDSVLGRAHVLGLRKAEGHRHPMPKQMWTDERVAWFRSFVPGHTEREISAEHERIWGFSLTEGQIGNAKTKLGVRSGTRGGQFRKGQEPPNKGLTWDEMGFTDEQRERMIATQFRKGNRPHNSGHLLDERVTKDGYVQVKVDPRNAKNPMGYWIGKGQFVWMQANGRDWPDGHRCVFADGNNRNFDPDNIVAVPNDLYPIVQGAVRNQMGYHDRETLEVAITSARLTRAVVDRRKALRRRRRKERK